MKTRLLSKKIPAFTLTELLVVLVIIGILVLLALPKMMGTIGQARSTEAKIQLGHLHTLEKSYFMQYSRYSSVFEDINYEHEILATDGGPANYKIEIVEAEVNTFKARATAVVDFDGDGVFNVWEIDQDKNLKEVTKD